MAAKSSAPRASACRRSAGLTRRIAGLTAGGANQTMCRTQVHLRQPFVQRIARDTAERTRNDHNGLAASCRSFSWGSAGDNARRFWRLWGHVEVVSGGYELTKMVPITKSGGAGDGLSFMLGHDPRRGGLEIRPCIGASIAFFDPPMIFTVAASAANAAPLAVKCRNALPLCRTPQGAVPSRLTITAPSSCAARCRGGVRAGARSQGNRGRIARGSAQAVTSGACVAAAMGAPRRQVDDRCAGAQTKNSCADRTPPVRRGAFAQIASGTNVTLTRRRATRLASVQPLVSMPAAVGARWRRRRAPPEPTRTSSDG